MKGKNTFTSSEIVEIKKLIVEKVRAPRHKQGGIRKKIRDIGFYWEDFNFGSSHEGYTVEDFDALIRFKQIKVEKDTDTPPKT
ncbi:MAG: hypothetical protein HY258_12050 [Chloroflexi bacterium]|nr:hypothetical protein [Chloroflexota bacterium]